MEKYAIRADDITIKIVNTEQEAQKFLTKVTNKIGLNFNKGKKLIEIDENVILNPDKIKVLYTLEIKKGG